MADLEQGNTPKAWTRAEVFLQIDAAFCDKPNSSLKIWEEDVLHSWMETIFQDLPRDRFCTGDDQAENSDQELDDAKFEKALDFNCGLLKYAWVS